MTVVEEQPLYRGGCCREVAVIRKGRLKKVDCCIVAVECLLLERGGRCVEVTVVETCML